LPLTKRTERNINVPLRNINILKTGGMSGVARDIAGAFSVPDNPQFRWPSLAQALLACTVDE
jgi:hypothetical protein